MMSDGIIRVGKVSAVDAAARKARVRFDDIGVTSEWMPILTTTPTAVVIIEGEERHISVMPWMPRIDDVVLCIFRPVFNGDGFIVGAMS